MQSYEKTSIEQNKSIYFYAKGDAFPCLELSFHERVAKLLF